MKPLIEICLGDAQGVLAAQNGGADRVELCSDLLEGGLTPSVGTFRLARKLADKIKINVMIRPRGGDFCYSAEEFAIMKEDLHIFKEEGADGLVFGILNPDSTIDFDRNAELISLAGSIPVTFHRAFDETADGRSSLETLVKLGATRVLTSGLAPSVPEGSLFLKELVQQAGDRIIVMPGCGIRAENFKNVQEIIGAKEYHMSAYVEYNGQRQTSEKKVREICRIC